MDSEVGRIREQFRAGQWPQFLEMVSINGLRGWQGQAITFQFPVCSIVGENGTGKSTILKAAACAYANQNASRNYYPSSFFPSTHWDRIEHVTLNYRVKLGSDVRNFKIRKPTKRWKGLTDRPEMSVFYFDISRTLPLDATTGYAKIAKLTASETATNQLNERYRARLSHILGRNYTNARFVTTDIDAYREVGLLRRDIGEISQFHQGAGEDTTLDLFRVLENLPDNSLLIIDEVEASLHPRAQRRLVRFLLWLARHKKLQVLLSTHSPYILQELPEEARILLLPGIHTANIVYGCSPEFAMSKIDEDIHPELSIFVEDRESKILLREIIVQHPQAHDILPRLGIFEVGPADVVQMLGNLAHENKLPSSGMGVLDGDYVMTPGCMVLPGGEAPERVVFNQLRDAGWPNLDNRFGIGAGQLLTYLEDAMLEPDHHRWTAIVGNWVIKSSTSVWETLCSQWARSCLRATDRGTIIDAIQERLP